MIKKKWLISDEFSLEFNLWSWHLINLKLMNQIFFLQISFESLHKKITVMTNFLIKCAVFCLQTMTFYIGSLNKVIIKITAVHTGSSRADFNHGLVVRPQGCQGCQKIHKNILQINLLSYCANIQQILKKLQKTSRSHQK